MPRLGVGLLIISALLSGASAARGQSAQELIDSGQVMVRTSLEPAERILVGQKVGLRVEVLTATFFPAAPEFPAEIEIANAVVRAPTSGQSFSERVNGQTLSGIARRYDIYPMGPGTIRTPEFEVRAVISVGGINRSPEIVLVAPSQMIEAALPAEAAGKGLVLAVPKLTVTEEYSADPKQMRVGDAVTRTVRMELEDSLPMLLPAPELTGPTGVASYPESPELEEKSNRGKISGSRVDRITYVFEEEGDYRLPAEEIFWWDLSSNELRRERLPPVRLIVRANDELAEEHLGEEEEAESTAPELVEAKASPWAALMKLVVLVAAIMVIRRLFRRWGRWRRFRARRKSREKARFEHFREVSALGSPLEIYNALMAWLDHATGHSATLEEFVEDYGDEALREAIESLETRGFGRRAGADGEWSGEALRLGVEKARRSMRNPHKGRLGRAELGPLNPRGA